MSTREIIEFTVIVLSMCTLGFGAMLIYALNPELSRLVNSILILSVPGGFLLGMSINYLTEQSG